jgi:hypothetical protein
LERAEASRSAATLAFNRSSRSATCAWVWAKAAVGPSEILLDQSNLISELTSIPLGKPGIDSWNLFSQPHPLVRFLSDGHMHLLERLMQLLALEV